MTSPLSGATLTAQRAARRWKTYHLAVSSPAAIFTAQINQTFPQGVDNILFLTYDNSTGDYNDVIENMTVLIGSTAGARDIGVVRARSADGANIYIGRSSGVQFANDQHITILPDFRIWAKYPAQSGGSTFAMDEDVEYSANAANAPIIRLGPPAYVLETDADTIDFTPPFSAQYFGGGSFSSILWTAPDADSITGDTTTTPTITYDATGAGEYYITCTLTDSNGASNTATRKVFVNPAPSAKFSVGDISGDIDGGGWSAEIEGYSGATVSDIQDGTMVVLYKRDYVGSARDTSYGPYTDAENVRLVGWVDGQSIAVNPNFGTLSFTIQGPAFWLQSVPGAPITLSNSASTGWDYVADMTVDLALRRLLLCTNVAELTDFRFTSDTTEISTATISTGRLYEQMAWLLQEKLIGRLCVDRFGCIYAQIPVSLLDDRSGIETLWALSNADWTTLEPGDRITVARSALVEINALNWDGSTDTELWSRAPGNSPLQYGEIVSPYSGLASPSQAALNALSGDVLAYDNNEWPGVDVELHWANDFIDIAPQYRVSASLSASQTPRGVTWTNKLFLPIAVSFVFENETGAEYTTITMEAETDGNDGVTFVPPIPPVENVTTPPGIGGGGFGGGWFPPVIPPVNCSGATTLAWSPSTISGATGPYSAYAFVDGTLRSAGQGGSSVEANILFFGDASDNISMYAVNSVQTRIETGVRDNTLPMGFNGARFTFSPATQEAISGFELAIVPGAGAGDAYTKALLHMDGTDGSTTFTDETGKAWIPTGGTQIDTAQYKFGGASGLFDGTGGLTSSPSGDWQIGGVDWTVDHWFKLNDLSSEQAFWGVWPGGGNLSYLMEFVGAPSPILQFAWSEDGTAEQYLSVAWTPDTDWHHLAVVQSGDTVTIYLDGSPLTFTTGVGTFYASTGGLLLGEAVTGIWKLNGWEDEFRFSKGIARYTAPFTPPVAPYGQIGTRTAVLGSAYAYNICGDT